MFIMLSVSNMWLIMYEMSIVPISHVNFFLINEKVILFETTLQSQISKKKYFISH